MDEWTYENDWWSNGRGWIRRVIYPEIPKDKLSLKTLFVCWVNGHLVLYWYQTIEEAKAAYYNYEKGLKDGIGNVDI